MAKPKKQRDVDKLYSLKDFSETEQTSIVSEISERYSSWESATSLKRSIITECRETLDNVLGGHETEDQDSNEHDVNLAILATAIRTARSRLSNIIFSDNWFNVAGQTKNDKEFAEKATIYQKHKLKQMGYTDANRSTFLACLTDGLTPTKVEWKEVKRPVRKTYTVPIIEKQMLQDANGQPIIDAETQMPIMEEVPTGAFTKEIRIENKTIYNGPVVRVLDILNLYFSPHVVDFKDADLIEETYMSYDDIENIKVDGQNAYGNIDKLKETDEDKKTRDDENSDTVTPAIEDGVNKSGVIDLNNILIWHFYGDINIRDKHDKLIKLRSYVITIANKNILLRCEPYMSFVGRKHPYQIFPCYDHPRSLWESKGIAEMNLSSQKYVNDFMRVSLAQAWANIRPRLLCSNGSIDEDMVNGLKDSDSGFCIEAPPNIDINADYKEISTPGNVTIPMQLMDKLIYEMEKASGESSISSGQFDSKDRTATEQIQRKNAIDIRGTDIISNWETPMTEQLNTIFEFCRMYDDDEVQKRLFEDYDTSYEEIHDDEINKNDLDFTITSIQTELKRAQQLDRLMKALEIIMSTPAMQNANVIGLVKQILEALGLQNVADLIKEEQLIPLSGLVTAMQHYGDMLYDPRTLNQTLQSTPEEADKIRDEILYSLVQPMEEGQNGQQGQQQG